MNVAFDPFEATYSYKSMSDGKNVSVIDFVCLFL